MTGYATPDLSAMYARLGPGICTYRADDGVNQLTLLREGREGRDGVPLQQLSLTQGEEHDGGVELVVAYSGDSRASMLKTLEALHLPKSWSKHYGQKPFHLLLGQLQLRGAYEGPLESIKYLSRNLRDYVKSHQFHNFLYAI
ncbi:hypothetical protein HYV82_01300 [Candidatus Woesearchaeota archaeon]|nr:hypothetical protein [Candidatus Woesearchaeota archaeon]